LGDDRKAFIGEELLQNKRSVARCERTEPHFACCAAIPVITQPPHCPDLAPSDFWLFPTLKMGLKGTRFATMEDIDFDGRTAKDSKRSLPSVLSTMTGSMEQVCVCAQDSYFEGD
jgi:hypothetical protein